MEKRVRGWPPKCNCLGPIRNGIWLVVNVAESQKLLMQERDMLGAARPVEKEMHADAGRGRTCEGGRQRSLNSSKIAITHLNGCPAQKNQQRFPRPSPLRTPVRENASEAQDRQKRVDARMQAGIINYGGTCEKVTSKS